VKGKAKAEEEPTPAATSADKSAASDESASDDRLTSEESSAEDKSAEDKSASDKSAAAGQAAEDKSATTSAEDLVAMSALLRKMAAAEILKKQQQATSQPSTGGTTNQPSTGGTTSGVEAAPAAADTPPSVEERNSGATSSEAADPFQPIRTTSVSALAAEESFGWHWVALGLVGTLWMLALMFHTFMLPPEPVMAPLFPDGTHDEM